MIKAAKEVGFFQIKNHGQSEHQMEQLWQKVQTFFSMSKEQKMEIATHQYNPKNQNTYRGYFAPDQQGTSYKEGFDIGPETPLTSGPEKFQEHNLWPSDLPDFRQDMVSYYQQLEGLGRRILHILGHAFSTSEASSRLMEMIDKDSMTTLRLLHYPVKDPVKEPFPCQGTSPSLACSEHTDSGIITILLQDSTGGLQVFDSTGSWLDVPYEKGTYVINIGDALARWSGGVFKATKHRVLAQSVERFSVPMFFEPHFDAPMDPFDQNSTLKYYQFLEEKIKQFSEFQSVETCNH